MNYVVFCVDTCRATLVTKQDNGWAEEIVWRQMRRWPLSSVSHTEDEIYVTSGILRNWSREATNDWVWGIFFCEIEKCWATLFFFTTTIGWIANLLKSNLLCQRSGHQFMAKSKFSAWDMPKLEVPMPFFGRSVPTWEDYTITKWLLFTLNSSFDFSMPISFLGNLVAQTGQFGDLFMSVGKNSHFVSKTWR